MINKLESGAKLMRLATELGMRRSTIYIIKKNKENVEVFIKETMIFLVNEKL